MTSSRTTLGQFSNWFCAVNRIEIVAEATVNPTEDQKKVEKALAAVLRDCTMEKVDLGREIVLLRARTQKLDSLVPLQALLIQDRIRDAARSLLYSGIAGKTLRFGVNKQVAYVNHISLVELNEEPPLGLIRMEIKCDDPESVIDWIAPRSR